MNTSNSHQNEDNGLNNKTKDIEEAKKDHVEYKEHHPALDKSNHEYKRNDDASLKKPHDEDETK